MVAAGRAGERGRAGSASTRYGSPASWRTRRCSSAPSGQSLAIRHDAYDRTSFMPGMILAVKSVAGAPRAHRRARHAPRILSGAAASLGPVDGPRQRILEATYACVARWGLSKTTVEDAAREAGLSRATVYRYFPGGRDELIDAVVSWQFLLFFVPPLRRGPRGGVARGGARHAGSSSPGRALLEHEVLQKMLETEPDVLMPKLTVESNRTVGLIAGFLVPYLHEHGMAEGVEVHEARGLPRPHDPVLHLVARALGPGRPRPGRDAGPHRAARRRRGGPGPPAPVPACSPVPRRRVLRPGDIDNETTRAIMSHRGRGAA